jgi:hypothetical protein
MGLYDISSATTTNLTTTLTDISVDEQDTEISTYTPSWAKWHGYYRKVPELQAVIDKVAEWACGRGIKAKDASKQKQLDKIRGFGKDTAQSIARNLIRTGKTAGDCFAEILKNNRGELVNLKPLNPGTIRIVADNKGIILRYEQISQKYSGAGGLPPKILATWAPDEIFHLPWNRIADEIHGISTIEKLETAILMIQEAESVMKKIIRRNAKPIVVIEADTDDAAKMAELKTKYASLIENDEAMIVSREAVKLLDFTSKLAIDPLPWMNYLIKKFIVAEGVPEVVLGSINAGDTEGASKILMLGFEQVVKTIQLFFEEQWAAQIGWEIDLPEPPSINPLVLTDSRKSGQGNSPTDINPTGQNK